MPHLGACLKVVWTTKPVGPEVRESSRQALSRNDAVEIRLSRAKAAKETKERATAPAPSGSSTSGISGSQISLSLLRPLRWLRATSSSPTASFRLSLTRFWHGAGEPRRHKDHKGFCFFVSFVSSWFNLSSLRLAQPVKPRAGREGVRDRPLRAEKRRWIGDGHPGGWG